MFHHYERVIVKKHAMAVDSDTVKREDRRETTIEGTVV